MSDAKNVEDPYGFLSKAAEGWVGGKPVDTPPAPDKAQSPKRVTTATGPAQAASPEPWRGNVEGPFGPPSPKPVEVTPTQPKTVRVVVETPLGQKVKTIPTTGNAPGLGGKITTILK